MRRSENRLAVERPIRSNGANGWEDVADAGGATSLSVEWRLSWRPAGSDPRGRGNGVRSDAYHSADATRSAALAVIRDAYGGEVRVSLTKVDGSTIEVFTSAWELREWNAEIEPLPSPVESRWQEDERRRGEALRYYCGVRDLLTKASYAGVIPRRAGRRLRVQARVAFLGE